MLRLVNLLVVLCLAVRTVAAVTVFVFFFFDFAVPVRHAAVLIIQNIRVHANHDFIENIVDSLKQLTFSFVCVQLYSTTVQLCWKRYKINYSFL